MSFNLTMLNLWIGMCRGATGVPKALREMGYQDKWIEWRFFNEKLEHVCPDLIVASNEMKHTMLLEFKSGANAEPDQLRRYSNVTRDDLVQKAFMEARAAERHDVTLVGQAEHEERLGKGLSEGGYSFPLLAAHDDGLALSLNQFLPAELNTLFAPTLKIDWDRVPTGFVPLDADSELWEVAEVVVPKVLQYLSERRPVVRPGEVCQDVCIVWGSMGSPAKELMEKKVLAVLREAARRHFKPYLRWQSHAGFFEVVDNPLDLKPDRRTAVYRKLQSAQKRFIKRLRRGLAAGGEQLSLFPE